MKRDDPLVKEALGAELGHEARSRSDDHLALKLWLRLLSCTTQIETELRRRLRKRFQITLGQFDYMAQLYRCPDGLAMGDLTRRLMVTGGSVTGTTDDLEVAGIVTRESIPSDRRTWIIRLTEAGKRNFEVMAVEHEQWLLELIGTLDERSAKTLHRELGALRMHLSARDK